MRINTLYEGHYRAIEEDFLELASCLHREDRQLTVISAGTGQLDRLRQLLLKNSENGIIGGIEFLPGIRHLAQKISPVPVPVEKVSHSDRTLFTLHAMKEVKGGEPLFDLRENTETAHSMGTFFENLFEHGITPELYEITSMSLTGGQSTTERTVGRILGRYDKERRKGYVSCGDMIMEREIAGGIQGAYIFYGFYDLNPAQRRFLKRFCKSAEEVFWFSPVSENSQWSSIYLRTGRLLQDMGIGSLVRSGNRRQMNSFAAFFEALKKQSMPVVPADGFRITAVSGEIGACRAALKRIGELNADKGIKLGRIAVVRRKQEGESLVRIAHHEGIPVNAPLKTKLSCLPAGSFILNLMKAIGTDFYYVHLENLLASGILVDEVAADPQEIIRVAENSGIRMGLKRWRDWYSSLEEENRLGSFLRKLDTFFSGLPKKALASEYLEQLRNFFEETALESIPRSIRDTLFDPQMFRFSGEVSMSQFSDSLRLYYQAKDIVLREPDPDGFLVLTIEKVRGSLFDSVLLMDMEEGIYPGSPDEDPRLSEKLRERLQMTLKYERETEDGFLLRQAGEAAGKNLDIIFRQTDNEGNEISPSPFISNLVHPEDNRPGNAVWFLTESSSPLAQMAGGSHPGQKRILAAGRGEYPSDPLFFRALAAERSRMDYDGFDCYDGIVDSSPVKLDRISPTLLEGYMRCPFALLMSKGWKKIERIELTEIGSSPGPITKGLLIHDAVEEIIEKHGFTPSPAQVEAILRQVGVSRGLAGKLGSAYFEEIFIEKQKDIILKSLEVLNDKDWRFAGREVKLRGSLGDLPITGTLDLILDDEESRLVLIDLKTGKLPSKNGIDKGRNFQLPFYYQLVKQNFTGKDIATVAYVAVSDRSPGKLVSFTGDEMESLMETVTHNAERIATMIRAGLFPPIPTESCDNCDYSGICRRNPFIRIKEKVKSDNRMEMFRGIMLKK
ncbi:MAG: PD-(D/E)XK nuclease family protein [Candidatus Aegiribacteria sp.]|nr:PD-(D/E)XK nuclease family protein [Candidatus Aegiribacteria sp.]